MGGYITAAYWFTSSTRFANPAVTLARARRTPFAGIASGSAPMFVLMQLLGGGLAIGVRVLYPQAAALAADLTHPQASSPVHAGAAPAHEVHR